jgi:glycogen synthase
MKIVALMSVYGERAVGGAERTAYGLAKNLVARGHTVHLLSLSPKGQPASTPRVDEGVQCEFIPLWQLYDPFDSDYMAKEQKPKNRMQHIASKLRKALWHVIDIYNLRMAWEVRKKLKRIRPDVMCTHTLQGFSVAVWAAAKSLGIKVVHMTHDHALICPSTAMTRGDKVCERVCASCTVFSVTRRGLASMPDAVTGPSEVVLQRHQQFGWFRQIPMRLAIPNALPADWSSFAADQVPLAPEQYTTERPLVFGFLGRVDESKGADTLMRALCQLSDDVLGRWRMVYAGQGSMRQLQTWVLASTNGPALWAKVSPYVTCLGLVKANDYLRSIDVLITPSRAHETFCNVVLEAASLARPAIVSDKGALPERIEKGASGWMVAAADDAALAEQMSALLRNPAEVHQKAQKAWELSQAYTAKRQGDLMEALLTKVVHG